MFSWIAKQQKTLISDEKSVKNKLPTGIEPVAVPYHGAILPLNYGSIFIINLFGKINNFTLIQLHIKRLHR